MRVVGEALSRREKDSLYQDYEASFIAESIQDYNIDIAGTHRDPHCRLLAITIMLYYCLVTIVGIFKSLDNNYARCKSGPCSDNLTDNSRKNLPLDMSLRIMCVKFECFCYVYIASRSTGHSLVTKFTIVSFQFPDVMCCIHCPLWFFITSVFLPLH